MVQGGMARRRVSGRRLAMSLLVGSSYHVGAWRVVNVPSQLHSDKSHSSNQSALLASAVADDSDETNASEARSLIQSQSVDLPREPVAEKNRTSLLHREHVAQTTTLEPAVATAFPFPSLLETNATARQESASNARLSLGGEVRSLASRIFSKDATAETEPRCSDPAAEGLGCKSGCSCSWHQSCYPKHKDAKSSEADIGTCSLSVPLLFTSAFLVFICTLTSVVMLRLYFQLSESMEEVYAIQLDPSLVQADSLAASEAAAVTPPPQAPSPTSSTEQEAPKETAATEQPSARSD